jgi:uncharacterized protein YfiM (DUF2279 family)
MIKKNRLFLLALAVILAGLLAFSCPAHAEDWSLQHDKKLHVTAGFMVSAFFATPAIKSDLTKTEKFLVCVSVAFFAGVGKELDDATGSGTGFSWADVAYTTAGGLAGAGLTLLNW